MERTTATDVDPATGELVHTVTDENTFDALIQEISVDRQQTDGRTLGLADRLVLLPAATDIEADQRVVVVGCSDSSLVGREGTVTDVERDSLRRPAGGAQSDSTRTSRMPL